MNGVVVICSECGTECSGADEYCDCGARLSPWYRINEELYNVFVKLQGSAQWLFVLIPSVSSLEGALSSAAQIPQSGIEVYIASHPACEPLRIGQSTSITSLRPYFAGGMGTEEGPIEINLFGSYG